MRSVKELMSLKDRVSLVTGGAGHIGVAIGHTLAELGSQVVVVDQQEDACHEIANVLKKTYSIETLPLVVNLAEESQIREIPGHVQKKFGRIDILVNCAAFVGTSNLKGWITSFHEQRADTWTQALQVNLTAPFILIQACTEALTLSGHGSIINIGSTYGVVGPDMRLYEGTSMGNPAAYAASKGGLLQLTRWLATVLAPKIRVNSISPGGVWREQPEAFVERYVEKTPLRRMANEEDFKGAIAYLASDLSRYVTGQNLVVDGGWTTW